jgi:hypothetical protein
VPKLFLAAGPARNVSVRPTLNRAKLELLGTIEAANFTEAIVKAMAEFNIPEERRKRIIVQKISKAKD